MSKTSTASLGLVLLGIAIPVLGAESPGERAFVEAVERAVEAIEAEDYDRFESLFSENTRGLQPDQLWRGAFGLLRKFGRIEGIRFSRRDEGSGGTFVAVTFERARREVFVRLSEKTGKIRELTYVPPANAH